MKSLVFGIFVASLAVASITVQQAFAIDSPMLKVSEDLTLLDTLRIVASEKKLQDGSVDPADVRVLLRNGKSYDGTITAFNQSKSMCTIVHRDGTTTLLNARDISTVTIIDPGAAKVALQGNKIYHESSDEVLTNLAFKRYLQALSQKSAVSVKASFEDSEIESDKCKFYSQKILEALEKSLTDIVADQEGRDAMKAHGNTISVSSKRDTSLAVEKSENGLALQFNCLSPLSGDYALIIEKQLNALL